ncbi:unnamed protein product [Rotaria sordida]|uniref:Uncharacterized protein n=1 Tax=Rotaria sordida TaxID=392033 RepID=A0A819F715_9BILA|nr:unnamed protein product [Rotaria sordida]CAF1164008.1 unnamed protein product [Rotaria sordida]CAF1165511.1 unnamed protein product [Rotaria sordida]CAF1224591.1 unnamed protein product [Rotaria sordida]CAF1415400.1 unnamed protein product [Rotaria sordida]
MLVDSNSVRQTNRRFGSAKLLNATSRVNYHNLIQSIWSGVVRSSPEQINNQCVDIVNTVLSEVIKCSHRLAYTEKLLQLLESPPDLVSITEVLVDIFIEAIRQWMESGQHEDIYRTCLNAAKLKWRSPIEIALLGL